MSKHTTKNIKRNKQNIFGDLFVTEYSHTTYVSGSNLQFGFVYEKMKINLDTIEKFRLFVESCVDYAFI